MRRMEKIVILACMVVCCLTGCSSGSGLNAEEDVTAQLNPMQKLAEQSIMEQYENAHDIMFHHDETVDNLHILSFTFENEGVHLGFAVIEQQKDHCELAYFEENPNFPEESLVKLEFVGSYPGRPEREIHILWGYVNDKDIDQVRLYYSPPNVVAIQMDKDLRMFMNVTTTPNDTITRIEGRSKDNKVLYEISW